MNYNWDGALIMAERKNKGLGMKISKLLKVLRNIAF
jgi:hypothetical protein